MIFNTSDIVQAWDAKLYVEQLADIGAVIRIEKLEDESQNR